jgi:hypothetical protein
MRARGNARGNRIFGEYLALLRTFLTKAASCQDIVQGQRPFHPLLNTGLHAGILVLPLLATICTVFIGFNNSGTSTGTSRWPQTATRHFSRRRIACANVFMEERADADTARPFQRPRTGKRLQPFRISAGNRISLDICINTLPRRASSYRRPIFPDASTTCRTRTQVTAHQQLQFSLDTHFARAYVRGQGICSAAKKQISSHPEHRSEKIFY